jgi:hypothetical protein
MVFFYTYISYDYEFLYIHFSLHTYLFLPFSGTVDTMTSSEDKSTTTVVSLMDVSSLTQPFVEATKLALEKIVAGTNASTIIEPQHQEILRVLISNLPCSPQVASARERL